MQSLTTLFHYRCQPVRTVEEGGEIWFIAADVCRVLGLANHREALSSLEADEKACVSIADTSSSSRKTVPVRVISEPGLYSLTLRSRKPEAKDFRRWITHEVIPALRRSGGYQMEAIPRGKGRLFPFSRRDLLALAIDAENECEDLRQQVEELAPKAEFYDRVADTTSTFSLAEVAKLMDTPGCGRNNLVKFLRDEGILMASNVAKQRYVDRGYFQIVQADYFAPDGSPRVKAVIRVKLKGVEFIRRRLDQFIRDYMERQNAGL